MYFNLIVQAVNRAGLKSDISTIHFISDLSPPTGGHVMDGHWTYKVYYIHILSKLSVTIDYG
jgi:hypothetical protein